VCGHSIYGSHARRLVLTRNATMIRLLSLVFLLACALPASAQVSVSARVEQVTEHVETWRSVFGYWVVREARNARVGMATITNKEHRSLDVSVEFYFIGQDRGKGGALQLYHFHRRSAKVPARGVVQVPTISRTIVLRKVLAKDTEDRSSVSGLVPFGWVVIVKKGSEVLDQSGNTPDAFQNLRRVLEKTDPTALAEMQKEAEERVARKD